MKWRYGQTPTWSQSLRSSYCPRSVMTRVLQSKFDLNRRIICQSTRLELNHRLLSYSLVLLRVSQIDTVEPNSELKGTLTLYCSLGLVCSLPLVPISHLFLIIIVNGGVHFTYPPCTYYYWREEKMKGTREWTHETEWNEGEWGKNHERQ